MLHNTSNRDWLAESVRPGEFWPPVRSVVVPIEAAAVSADRGIVEFLAALEDGPAAAMVWWTGIARRSDRLHATVCGAIDHDATIPDMAGETMLAVVRGPWIGRINTGRVYLPVEFPDADDRRRLTELRDHFDVPHRPLLAGYLQLTDDVIGPAYLHLRELIGTYQSAVHVPLAVSALQLMETMDDLALRSRVVDTIPVT